MLSRATRSAYHTLHDAAVLADPSAEAVALIYLQRDQPAQSISRAAFRRAVLDHAAALQQLGVGQGDVVIIAHTQDLEGIYSFWACLWLGAVPSFMAPLTEKLDPTTYLANLTTLVAHVEPRVVLTHDEFVAELEARVTCRVVGRIEPIEGRNIPSTAPEPHQIALLQHSSGTTGLAKGVALSHAAILNQLAAYSDSLALSSQDVLVSWLPLYHDMGLIAGFLLPLIQGVPLVLMSPFEWVKHPVMLLRAISEYHGTLCWLPNFAYNHCARRIRSRDLEGLSLASMRAFINCSEPVSHASHSLFVERFGPLGVEPTMLGVSYAMAENTFAVTQTPIGEPSVLDIIDRAALEGQQVAQPCPSDTPTAMIQVSCGPPIANTEVGVITEGGAWLPERHVGEVVVRSNCMLTEYYRRPDIQVWHESWYRTGDMGYVVDGQVYIVGRKKDVIINAGKNVFPQDLEAIVNTVDGVYPGRVVAFGVYDERDGTELIGILAESSITGREEQRQIERDIRERIATQTTVSATYVQVVPERWLLKTSSGKIARAANREKWLATRE